MSLAPIGALRRRMRLEQQNRIGDGIGGAFTTWQLVDTLWVGLVPLSGNELVHAAAVRANVSHEIWLRYRPGVTPDMRFVQGLRRYDILMVIDHGDRRRRLRVLVEERDL